LVEVREEEAEVERLLCSVLPQGRIRQSSSSSSSSSKRRCAIGQGL
jgi:hypothetical protein